MVLDYVFYGDVKNMQKENEYSVVNLSKTSYAFYLAGIAKGRLDMLNGYIDQLSRAMDYYTEIMKSNPEGSDEELDNINIVAAIGSISKQFKEMIPQLEGETKGTFKAAMDIETSTKSKQFSAKLVNAIDGMIAGWNK